MSSLIFFLLSLLASPAEELIDTHGLRTGDLLFVTEGKSDFSNAITQATGNQDSLQFIHVGILIADSIANLEVLDASPELGVRITSLQEFLKESPLVGENPGVVVKRVNIDFPLEETIGRAKSFIGQEYDWWYLPDNDKIYCSELIYESFIDKKGNPIFESKPMNFKAPDGSMPLFWVQLFEKLGQSIPQGVPGTNPNDMARSDKLTEIFRFF